MDNVLISPCTEGDIPDLIAIATTAYKQHYTYLWHDSGEEYVARCFSDRTIRREMKDPNAAFYMIYYQGLLAGFLKLNLEAPLAERQASESLELERVYLIKEATGQGVGQQVMDFTFNLARQREQRTVWLKVMDSCLPAIRFYEKAGFEKCDSLVLDMPLMKQEYRGILLLKKELTSEAPKKKAIRVPNHKSTEKEMCIG